MRHRATESGNRCAGVGETQLSQTKKVFRSVLKSGLVLAALVIAIAALAWYLAAPRGELRLAVPPSFDGDKLNDTSKTAVAADLFTRVESLVDEVQEDHEWLSLTDANQPEPLVRMPPRERPGGHTLQKLITGFIIETSFDQKSGRVALSIDGIALLESLYGMVGWQDYFLEISSIDEVACESEGEENCFEVIAHFSPSRQRINIKAKGKIDELARELAFLVLRGVVFNSEVAWKEEMRETVQPLPYVPAKLLPKSMAALEASATGIEILLKGQGYAGCGTQTDCRDRAKYWFEQAVERDAGETNPIAALGLGLIAMEEGLLSARRMMPRRLVESKLKQANTYMSKVRYDDFVRDRLESQSFASKFAGLNLAGAVLDEKFFKQISNFVCVLDAYHRGSWKECLRQIGDLDDYPKALIPYLEPAQLHARLRSAATDTEKQAGKSEVRKRLHEVETNSSLPAYPKRIRKWALQRVIILDACADPDHGISEQEFSELAKGLVNFAPHQEARLIAKVEVEGCIPVYSPVQGNQSLNTLVRQLDDDGARHRLEFALAKYYVRVNDLDLALQLLKNALPLSYVGPYVRDSDEFLSFRESKTHSEAFFEAYYAGLAGSMDLSCSGGGLF